ncbi:MAG: MFS transporter [Clostridia bacterium]|nr:MFS transporter [Clostridia bacterium]
MGRIKTEKKKNVWNTPPKGRYMSVKEITSLSVGGIGVRLIAHCINQMIISTNNTLLGNTIGIDAGSLYVIYILGLLSSFPLTGLRANIIDNTRSMKGKYRPYIITMGIPTVIIGVFSVMLPYETMTLFEKCFWVLLCNIGFQFFFNFMMDAYESLINVLSPDSIERTDVLSVRCIVENISPSIANIFFPIAAKLITGENTLYDMRVYRAVFPPMLLLGFLISIIVYVNTEEKIVRAKSHVISVRFSDAFRAVATNKYFWVISLAGWMGFLEGAFASIMGWMYNYQDACTAAQYSVITAIAGNASFWPNIIAPFFIRRFGKKKIIIFSNVLNIGLIALMLPVVRMTGQNHIIWMLLFCSFMNQLITSLGHFITPGINADIRDYQQYISGERIDGMFAAVGLIGNVISMITSGVLPVIYNAVGLNKETAVFLGFSGENVYDVLYDHSYFVKICSVLVIVSVIGAVMNVIPMFFYDFTEAKQKAVINVLKIRAAFEDMKDKKEQGEEFTEAVAIIDRAKEYCGREYVKGRNKKARKENEEIEIARFVIDEINYYNTPKGIFAYGIAERIVSAGLDSYYKADIITLSDIRELPEKTAEEKEIKKYARKIYRDIRYSGKAARKYFPEGIKEFDEENLSKLYKDEYNLEVAFREGLNALKKAKEEGNNTDVHKNGIEELKRRRKQLKKEIKVQNRLNSVYYSAAKPWIEAKRMIKTKNDYAVYSVSAQ